MARKTNPGRGGRRTGHDARREGDAVGGEDRAGPDPVLGTADFEAVVRHHGGTRGRVDERALIRRYREVRGTARDGPRDPTGVGTADDVTPETYAKAIRRLALEDPERAGDRIGELVVLVEGFDGAVAEAAGKALDRIGDRRPHELERWTADLAVLAGGDDPDTAFYGLRGLAQVASVNPRAAADGIDAARDRLTAESDRVRKAAYAVLAEVASTFPREVRPVDRTIADALREETPEVRAAAAITAGRVLGEDPNHYPRTATALFDAVEAETAAVRDLATVALVNFGIEFPEAVPDKERVVRHLDGLRDSDLGLKPGTVADAEIALLTVLAGIDPPPPTR